MNSKIPQCSKNKNNIYVNPWYKNWYNITQDKKIEPNLT